MSRDTTLDAERRASPPGDFETAIARQCVARIGYALCLEGTSNNDDFFAELIVGSSRR
jgi:hypothetical protein